MAATAETKRSTEMAGAERPNVTAIRHETPSGPRYIFQCRHDHAHDTRIDAAACSRTEVAR